MFIFVCGYVFYGFPLSTGVLFFERIRVYHIKGLYVLFLVALLLKKDVKYFTLKEQLCGKMIDINIKK